jgi:hypothetical protein
MQEYYEADRKTGRVMWYAEISNVFHEDLELENFPFDRQVLCVVVSSQVKKDKLRFVPNLNSLRDHYRHHDYTMMGGDLTSWSFEKKLSCLFSVDDEVPQLKRKQTGISFAAVNMAWDVSKWTMNKSFIALIAAVLAAQLPTLVHADHDCQAHHTCSGTQGVVKGVIFFFSVVLVVSTILFVIGTTEATKMCGHSSNEDLSRDRRVNCLALKDCRTPNFHCAAFQVCAERRFGWHINNIYLVTLVLGAFAGSSSMLEWDDTEARLNMIIAVILTFVVYKTWIAGMQLDRRRRRKSPSGCGERFEDPVMRDTPTIVMRDTPTIVAPPCETHRCSLACAPPHRTDPKDRRLDKAR